MNTKVSLYTRDERGKYHKTDSRGIYPKDRTSFIIRYTGDNMKRVWETLPKGTDFAGARKLALEKELRLSDPSLNTPSLKRVPVKVIPPLDGRVGIADAAEKYIDLLWAENNHVAKTVRVKAQELRRFAEFCRTQRKKEHVANLDRHDMLAYRDWLYSEGYMPWTVVGDLMSATTMLKKNPLLSVRGLLTSDDWPDFPDTEPAPYSDEEVEAMLCAADEDEALFIRFMLGSGCRNMEAAHLQWGDIDYAAKTVWIHAKLEYGWKPKTTAGTRRIPLSDSLIAALKAKRGAKDVLVFPAKCGKVNRHLLRIIQRVAKRAGVEGAILHRCRDTWATNMLRQPDVDLLTLRVWIGHESLDVLKLYAQALKTKDEKARNAANAVDYHRKKAVAAD
ncbi:MAG TPA: site-specific integrase [Candidatus Acidoferrales bacterium]|nr:site-specific integrase [Candidatus Acidoferrales bacterium]